jgi:hypothetical protein
MTNLSTIIYTVIALIIFVPLISSIFGFFDIGPDTYMPYLGWTIALLLFFVLLPKRIGTMFE